MYKKKERTKESKAQKEKKVGGGKGRQEGHKIEREVIGQNSHSVERVKEEQRIEQRDMGNNWEIYKRMEDLQKTHIRFTTLKECKVCQRENKSLEDTKRSI